MVKTWLDSNPGQVVTILLTNPEGQPITRFQTAMVDSGLSTYAYTPATTLAISEWPTLQTMIDAGERLVLFMGKWNGLVQSDSCIFGNRSNLVWNRLWSRCFSRAIHT